MRSRRSGPSTTTHRSVSEAVSAPFQTEKSGANNVYSCHLGAFSGYNEGGGGEDMTRERPNKGRQKGGGGQPCLGHR
jgi:hypothetical protein